MSCQGVGSRFTSKAQLRLTPKHVLTAVSVTVTAVSCSNSQGTKGATLQSLLIALLSLLSVYVAGVLVTLLVLSRVGQVPLHWVPLQPCTFLPGRTPTSPPRASETAHLINVFLSGCGKRRQDVAGESRHFLTEIITDKNTQCFLFKTQ